MLDADSTRCTSARPFPRVLSVGEPVDSRDGEVGPMRSLKGE